MQYLMDHDASLLAVGFGLGESVALVLVFDLVVLVVDEVGEVRLVDEGADGGGLLQADAEAEVVVDEDPLVEVELVELHERDHLDQLEAGQDEVEALVLRGGLLGENLDEEGEQNGPDVAEQVVQLLGGEAHDEDADAEHNQYQQTRVDRFGALDDLRDLLEEGPQLVGVPVSLAAEDDEADALEAFDALFVLHALVAEEGRLEGDLVEVLEEEVGLVELDDPVDDLLPVLEGLVVLDEEVLLVEELEDGLAEGLDEDVARLVEEGVEEFGDDLEVDLVVQALVLHEGEERVHELLAAEDDSLEG